MTSSRVATWVSGLPSTKTCSGCAAMPSADESALVVHTVQKRTMSAAVDQVEPEADQEVGTSAPDRTGAAPSAARMVRLLSTEISPSL